MKKLTVAILVLFSGFSSEAQLIPSEKVRAAYEICQKAMNEGFGSQSMQIVCQENFEMPDPYTLKCVRWVKQGFPTEGDKKACQLWCASNKNWGPWYDYEIPFDEKLIFHEMKRRSLKGLCFEK